MEKIRVITFDGEVIIEPSFLKISREKAAEMKKLMRPTHDYNHPSFSNYPPEKVKLLREQKRRVYADDDSIFKKGSEYLADLCELSNESEITVKLLTSSELKHIIYLNSLNERDIERYYHKASFDDVINETLVSDYLGIEYLLDLQTRYIATNIKEKSVQELRKLFKVAEDFTPEEKEQIKMEIGVNKLK